MKYLLSRDGQRALGRFAHPGTLVALDYDGTLRAITRDPHRAHLRATTRKLLACVASTYRTLVLTGRSRQDVRRFLATIGDVEVIGNHGMETRRSKHSACAPRVGSWRAHLNATLAHLRGIRIEDKTYSLAVHYRQARDPALARVAVEKAASQLDGARLLPGKMVLNVIPERAPHKGTALLDEMSRIGAERAIFVGDDATDEDVFALGTSHQVLCVRVGRDSRSRATYFLKEQSEIDALLDALLSFARARARVNS